MKSTGFPDLSGTLVYILYVAAADVAATPLAVDAVGESSQLGFVATMTLAARLSGAFVAHQ